MHKLFLPEGHHILIHFLKNRRIYQAKNIASINTCNGFTKNTCNGFTKIIIILSINRRKKGNTMRQTLKINHNKKFCCIYQVIILMIITCIPAMCFANISITQTIHLKAGWNAIFVEILPDEPDPDVLFNNTPVSQILAFLQDKSSVQFIESPDEIDWKSEKWCRWVPPNGPESFLKNLYSIKNDQAYIVFAASDYTLNITGTPSIQTRQWFPDAYNLVGFYVDPVTPPTFEQYFAGSRNHQDTEIFTLANNTWNKIKKIDQTNIESGKAYWVFCNGGSQYSGPLEVVVPGTGNDLDFGRTIPQWELSFVNHSPDPLSFTVTPIPNSATDIGVPMSIQSYTDLTVKVFTPFQVQTPPMNLEAGQSLKLNLSIRRDFIDKPEISSLLKIADDLGNRFYLPIRAEQ